MSEESRGVEPAGGDSPGGGGPGPRAVVGRIRERWERRQSDWLMVVMGGVLSVYVGLRIFAVVGMDGGPGWFFWSVAASAGLAVMVWRLRAGTAGAAALGGFLCLAMLLQQRVEVPWTQTGVPELLLLFVLTLAATRFGRRRKEALGLVDRRERRGRQAVQVMANLGVAGYLSGTTEPAWIAGVLAALVEATADTVSSEMGQVLGGRTVLITTGRTVAAGTDGGVSVAGTLCGVVSAAMVAGLAVALGAVSGRMGVVVFAAGCGGLLFDSLLGATLERWGWLGNDLVNFASTWFAAWVAIFLFRFVEPPYAFW